MFSRTYRHIAVSGVAHFVSRIKISVPLNVVGIVAHEKRGAEISFLGNGLAVSPVQLFVPISASGSDFRVLMFLGSVALMKGFMSP